LCVLAGIVFICFGFGFWREARRQKKEIFSWQFNGTVKNLHSIGNDVLDVTINNKEYILKGYFTGLRSHVGYNGKPYNSYIDEGDTLIKQKNEWNLKLIKKDGKSYVFRSSYNE
jgi:hypothetical protein